MNISELKIKFKDMKDALSIVRDTYKDKLDVHRSMSSFERNIRFLTYRKKEEKIMKTISNIDVFENRLNGAIELFNLLFKYYDKTVKYEFLEDALSGLKEEILKIDRWYEYDSIPFWTESQLSDIINNIELSLSNAQEKIKNKEKESYHYYNSWHFNNYGGDSSNGNRQDFKGFNGYATNNNDNLHKNKRKMPTNIIKALLNIEMPKGSDVNRTIVKQQYKKVSKKYHPDINPNGEEKMKSINSSYEELLAYFK